MISGGAGIRTFRLEGSRGALLALYYTPTGTPHPAGDVLVVPAFAEEMNRCRAMVALQARALARIGIGTLVLDPFGTGDSDGEFSEATWSTWRDDLQRGVRWLREKGGGCRTLWGIRLGALMAADLAAEDRGLDRLLFWQPALEGKQHFTQFLRIRIAAELERSGGIKSTEDLRKLAAGGEIIEVSGYRLNGDLARELDALRLPEAARLRHASVIWCEVVPAPDSNVPRGNLKIMEAWQAAGIEVQFERVVGPAFWQVHEREVATDLIVAGTQRMSVASVAPQPLAPAGPPAMESAEEREYPVSFRCDGDELIGVIHRGRPGVKRGVVIIVAGGPQYRAGAHRQFVSLARRLAARGHAVLRFDLRGMGDSAGEHRGFQHSDGDIRSAIDVLLVRESHLDSVVLLGECESASGILFYAFRDARAQGAVLVNPWVRTEGGRAEVIMKHYYLGRLASREFWRKLASGQFRPLESLRSFASTVAAYLAGRKLRRATTDEASDIANLPLPLKTAAGLRRFRGPVLLLMSGNDYIAREFDEVIKSSQAWAGLLDDPRVTRHDLAGADHTFSREEWKKQAQDWVCDWVGGL
jgi:exosortase A-associated hydrolase 1/exosortase A-associated hydrolase 2